MVSILTCSGRPWFRAAFAWTIFVVAVYGLADAGAEAADARLSAHTAAVALGVLDQAMRLGRQSSYQIPKIDVVDLDLTRLEPAAFGDREESGSTR